jgi:hypothetical protein
LSLLKPLPPVLLLLLLLLLPLLLVVVWVGAGATLALFKEVKVSTMLLCA